MFRNCLLISRHHCPIGAGTESHAANQRPGNSVVTDCSWRARELEQSGSDCIAAHTQAESLRYISDMTVLYQVTVGDTWSC